MKRELDEEAAADSRARVLILEDNQSLRDGLALNLRLRGYRAMTAADGDTGLQRAFEERPDLIVLDLMLPKVNGLEVLRELRRRGERVPILILSARDATRDKVSGLELGADDYMTKPFDITELVARVGAMLRRRHTETLDKQIPINCGDLEIDPVSRRVLVQGREIALSARAFDLLFLLASSPGKVFPRAMILERIWGWDYEGTSRTVDNFVANLRKKIEPPSKTPVYIHCITGIGYRFEYRGEKTES